MSASDWVLLVLTLYVVLQVTLAIFFLRALDRVFAARKKQWEAAGKMGEALREFSAGMRKLWGRK